MNVQRILLLAWLCLVSVATQSAPSAAPPRANGRKPAPLAASGRKDSLGDLLPPGAVARFGTRRLCLPPHTTATGGLLFTPDGKRLITSAWLDYYADAEHGVQVWDVSSGALVASFGQQEGGVVSLALARDGKLLATGGKDGSIDLWHLPTRNRIRRLREKGGMPDLAFTPDGRCLICTHPGIQVWDVRTGKKLKRYPSPHPEGLHDLDLAPDGKTLAVSAYSLIAGKAVTVLEVDTGKRLFTVPAGKDAAVVFSPDGAILAAVGRDGLLRLHDARSGKIVRQWQAWREPIANVRHRPIAYAPGGKVLAIGDTQGPVTLWCPSTGKALRQLPASDPLARLTFSPDGKLLAAWGMQTVTLLDAATGKPHLALPGHTLLVTSVAAFAGGDLFASAGYHRVLVWDRRKPVPVATYPVARGAGAISCQGSDLFAFQNEGRQKVVVYRRSSQKPVAEFAVPRYLGPTCLSPDGKLLACVDIQATLFLYSLAEKKRIARLTIPLEKKPFLRFCNALAFSLDGRHLAAACSDGTLRLCDVARRRWVRTLDGGERLTRFGFAAGLAAVAYDPTGLLLAARGEGKLIFWDAAFGELVQRINVDDLGPPSPGAVDFSPDGRYLASCEGNLTATLWEVRSGEVVGQLQGHQGSVIGVCFLAGGRQVLTGSHDHTLLLWDRALLDSGGPVAGNFEGAWKDLRGSAGRAHAAIWRMVRSPGAEAFLAKRLVAIPAAREKGQAERIKGWIADLAAGRPAVREAARRQLLANLDHAEAAIVNAAKKASSAEAKAGLVPLLARVFKRRQSPERLRTDRALAVLEYLGSSEAKKVLKGLAAGAAEHWLTQEAKDSLQRLDSRSDKKP